MEATLQGLGISVGQDRGIALRGLLGLVNYASHYSPMHLLLHGSGNLRFGTSTFGVLGYLSFAGLLAGLVVLLVRRSPLDKVLL